MNEPLRIDCPACESRTQVGQVQGDRCEECGFEFKWFAPDERRTAEDYLAILTGRKYLAELPEAAGWLIAHE